MTVESIKVSFLGVSERARSAYKIFFESIGHVGYELVDDYSKAQVCLVDTDAYGIQHQYEALVKDCPEMYVLVLSITECSCARDREFFIKKPAKRGELQKSLTQIFHCCPVNR